MKTNLFIELQRHFNRRSLTIFLTVVVPLSGKSMGLCSEVFSIGQSTIIRTNVSTKNQLINEDQQEPISEQSYKEKVNWVKEIINRRSDPSSFKQNMSQFKTLSKTSQSAKFKNADDNALISYLAGTKVNMALRGQQLKSGESTKLEPFQNMITELDHILSFLDKFEGICFRGHSFEIGTLNNLKVGQLWQDPGYLSTSFDIDTSRVFARPRYSHLEGAILIIISKTGRIVPEEFYLSTDESEIIFPRNSKFRILEVDHNQRPFPFVYLEEI